jgi:hypothetical protein
MYPSDIGFIGGAGKNMNGREQGNRRQNGTRTVAVTAWLYWLK